MPEHLTPSNPEALRRCQLGLGCAARERCIAAPIREGIVEINNNVRVEQRWAELQADITGDQLLLDEALVEVIEGHADLLETLRANLAKCGYLLLRSEDRPESA